MYVLIGHDHFGNVGNRVFGSLPHFFKHIALSPFARRLPGLHFSLPTKREVMAVLAEFLEAGKLTPVIDSTFSLEDVPDAMQYLQTGQARGKIIITP